MVGVEVGASGIFLTGCRLEWLCGIGSDQTPLITSVIKEILRQPMGTIVSVNATKLAAYVPRPDIKG
jgi:hypothetical protein